MVPRVAFTTLGCKVNQFETEIMEGLFKQRGYAVTPFDQVADVYIINTCSVTHLGEKKSRQLIRRAIRLNPKAIVAATGCYAQVSPQELEAISGIRVIAGTKDRHRIVDLVEAAGQEAAPINAVSGIMDAAEFEDIPLFDTPGRTRVFLKIQEGCTNFCTYCIIPYARGPLRSRPLASIVSESQKLVEAGYKEIVLTGIHLGAYGRDLEGGLTIADAAKAVLSLPGLEQLRLGSLESIEVSPDLLALFKEDERLQRHLHLPLQAGDNEVLRRMNRHYNLAEYQELTERIEREIPDIAITTDIIVGFPGETEEMFQNALDFVESMNFAKVHIFPYSRRSGTPAASFDDQVPEEDKKRRVKLMQAAAAKPAKRFLERFIGRSMSVLWETEHQGVVDGLTGNYIKVYARSGQPVTGQRCQVQLEKIYRDGLWGRIL